MVKAVIFDMDGLMFDTERLWDTLWEPACKELGLPLPPDMAKFQAGGRGLAGDNLRRHVAQYIPGDPQKVLDKVWQLADERFAQGVPCKPGLKELLSTLEDLGMPRIVASSSPRNMIEMNLQTSGTARYFHDVVSGTEVARSKPAPDTFLLAAEKLHTNPKDCLVLEDSFNGQTLYPAELPARNVYYNTIRSPKCQAFFQKKFLLFLNWAAGPISGPYACNSGVNVINL